MTPYIIYIAHYCVCSSFSSTWIRADGLAERKWILCGQSSSRHWVEIRRQRLRSTYMHSTIPTSQPTDDPVKMALAVSAMAELSQVSKSYRRQREEDGTAVDIDVPNSNLALDTPTKKRKRPRKIGPEKKFECKYEGCGKSYSRAEHLYRHQLNRMSHKCLSPLPRWRRRDCWLTRSLIYYSRHAQTNISMRLSRLLPILRATRSLCSTPREAYHQGLPASKA